MPNIKKEKDKIMRELDLTKAKPMSNHVLIKLDKANEKVVMPSGLELWIDISHEPGKHETITGTVVKPPDHLFYKRGKVQSMPWDIDMELIEGDRVWSFYLAVQNAIEDKRFFKVDETVYVFINYMSVFVAKRDDQIIMLNGYILVSPHENELEKEYEHIVHEKKESQLGVVEHIGSMIREYKDPAKKDAEVEVGDLVMFTKNSDIPLEYDLHVKFDKGKKFFRMQRSDIVAKLN
jgi:co-chaperonin GroES (HSP10)